MKTNVRSYHVAGRVVWGQGCGLLVGRSVHTKMMRPAEEQQKDGKKGQARDKPRRG